MDFSFTAEQTELRALAHDYLADRLPLERAAELADSTDGWDPASWAELADLGWLGVTVPEELGGVGLGCVESAILIEELGYALYSGPFLATVACALPALPDEEQARVATGDVRWSAEVDGLVPDLGRVDRVVTSDGAAPATGETIETVDPTRPFGRLSPDVDRAPLPGTVDLVRVYVACAAEAVGVAQRALELAVVHASNREQFARPIGTFQAVSHPIAETYAEVELAQSLVYWAAWSADHAPEQARLAAAAANAYAVDLAVSACERSIQVHGGVGFTWEHSLHRFYRRAQWLQAFGGYPAQRRAEVAAAILAT